MLDEYYEVEESPVPKSFSSDKVMDWAKELGEDFEYYRKARQLYDKEIVPECDKAFMCIKPDIQIGALKQIDNGMLGDATIRIAVKGYRNQMMAQINTTDESWLACASFDDEEDDDEDLLEKLKDMNLRLNYDAGTMDALAVAFDQLLVRGMTAVGVRWETRRVLRPIPVSLAETITILGSEMEQMGMLNSADVGIATSDNVQVEGDAMAAAAPPSEEIVQSSPITPDAAKKVKMWKDFVATPVVYPIDIYRLYFDPKVEMTDGADMPYVYITFKTKADLKNAKDKNTGKPVYDQKGVKEAREWTYEEYFSEFPESCEATRTMGLDPGIEEAGTFVPVYIFYKLEREFEDGAYFVDKLFYVVRTDSDGGWRIIRIQDNPSEYGDKPFYFMTCDQWLNIPMGTGIVEKSLSTWKAKCLMADMGLMASCFSVIPPMWNFAGTIKDDKQPKMMLGGFQQVIYRPGIGKDWMGHYPVNPNGVQISQVEEAAQGQKIIDQTGITTVGVKGSPQMRKGSKERTATEVRQEATEGIIGLQYIVERACKNLVQPVAQTIYNGARQHYSSGYKFISRTPTGEIKPVHISALELDKERKIEVIGKRAMDNKAHIMENLMKALEILMNKNASAVMGPTFALMAHDILLKIIMRLGIPMKPEYKQSTLEIVAGQPQAQLEMLEAALQTPEGQQIAAEILLNSPQGQQFMQQVAQMGADQGAQQQKPPGGPPK